MSAVDFLSNDLMFTVAGAMSGIHWENCWYKLKSCLTSDFVSGLEKLLYGLNPVRVRSAAILGVTHLHKLHLLPKLELF